MLHNAMLAKPRGAPLARRTPTPSPEREHVLVLCNTIHFSTMPDLPLPSSTDPSMRAQPAIPRHLPLLHFFATALSTFESSSAPFEVISTLPPWQQQQQHGARQQSPAPIRPQTPPRSLVVLDSSFNPPTIAHMRMARSALAAVERRRLLLLLSVNNADKAPKPAAFAQRLAMMLAFARDLQAGLVADDGGEEREDKHEHKHEQDAEGGLAIDLGLTTRPYFHDKSAAIAASGFYKPSREAEGGYDDGQQQQQQPEQVFLAGYDTLVRIFNPKYYKAPASGEDGGGSSQAAPTPPMQTALTPFFDSARLRVTMRADDEWGGRDEQAAYVDSLLHGDTLEAAGGRREWASRIALVEGAKASDKIVSSTMARTAARDQDWAELKTLVSPGVAEWIETQGLYTEGP